LKDFKLKLILTVLSALVFSFIFILLAFALPLDKNNKGIAIKKPKGKLEQVAQSFRNK
jgi:uncharacterized membrane protein